MPSQTPSMPANPLAKTLLVKAPLAKAPIAKAMYASRLFPDRITTARPVPAADRTNTLQRDDERLVLLRHEDRLDLLDDRLGGLVLLGQKLGDRRARHG